MWCQKRRLELPGEGFMTVECFGGDSAFRQIEDFRNSDAVSSKSFLCQSGIFVGGVT